MSGSSVARFPMSDTLSTRRSRHRKPLTQMKHDGVRRGHTLHRMTTSAVTGAVGHPTDPAEAIAG